MKELSCKEEKEIYCGGTISSTLVNVFLKGINIFSDLGRNLGSSLRRLFSHDMCDF